MYDGTHITADLKFKSRCIILCFMYMGSFVPYLGPPHDRLCTAEVYVHVFLADQDHNER